jgi:hypothetical protein
MTITIDIIIVIKGRYVHTSVGKCYLGTDIAQHRVTQQA